MVYYLRVEQVFHLTNARRLAYLFYWLAAENTLKRYATTGFIMSMPER